MLLSHSLKNIVKLKTLPIQLYSLPLLSLVSGFINTETILIFLAAMRKVVNSIANTILILCLWKGRTIIRLFVFKNPIKAVFFAQFGNRFFFLVFILATIIHCWLHWICFFLIILSLNIVLNYKNRNIALIFYLDFFQSIKLN